jgi:hypothetical protein
MNYSELNIHKHAHKLLKELAITEEKLAYLASAKQG